MGPSGKIIYQMCISPKCTIYSLTVGISGAEDDISLLKYVVYLVIAGENKRPLNIHVHIFIHHTQHEATLHSYVMD
jgi:hypothetical protein